MKKLLLALALVFLPAAAAVAYNEALPPGAAAVNGAVPHVANLSALQAYATRFGSHVHRDGYLLAGDGGEADYNLTPASIAANCAALGLPNDGGSCQDALGGGAWLIGAQSYGADLRIYGFSVLSTDNSAAITAATAAAMRGVGNGNVIVPATYGLAAQSANLDLSAYKNVNFFCNPGVSGLQSSNLTAPCTIKLNPAFSFKLGANMHFRGVRIVNQNIEVATSSRGAIQNGQNMAGTGVIVNYDDDSFEHVTVNGFNQAFFSENSQRLRMDDVVGDDTNFVSTDLCNDTCQFTRLEAWPFLAGSQIPQTYSVTGVTNSGGKFEIAYNNTMGTPLVSNDIVVLHGLGGTGQPLGRYTITVVDSSHFTLNGSTYASGYTSGGLVELSTSRRVGTAFAFNGIGSGGEYLAGLWEYGHDVALSIGEQHGPDDVHYAWFDGDTSGNSYADQYPTGVVHAGFGGGIFGGAILNKTISVYVDTDDVIPRPFTINGVSSLGVSGCLASNNANAGAAVTLVSGTVLMSDTSLAGMNLCASGYNAFSIGSGANAFKISSSQLFGAGVYFQTPAMCPIFTVDGTSPNCTPTSSGMSCVTGGVMWDADYEYRCIAANTWKRAALSSF